MVNDAPRSRERELDGKPRLRASKFFRPELSCALSTAKDDAGLWRGYIPVSLLGFPWLSRDESTPNGGPTKRSKCDGAPCGNSLTHGHAFKECREGLDRKGALAPGGISARS